jgi:hypothetical protein
MPRYKTMNKKLKYTDQVDFRTPKYLFNFLNTIAKIEYDGACIEGINNLAKPLRLEDEWPNGVIYSNPPFDIDSICKWIEKGYIHSRSAKGNIHLMIIPNKITQVKFQNRCKNLIDKMIFLGGRVNFESIYSVKGGSSRNGSIILIQAEGESGFEFVLLSDLKK